MARWWQTLKALWAGGGIGRILMDSAVASHVVLSGRVLDVGGRGEHSYHGLLDTSAAGSFNVLDIAADDTVDIVGSVTHLPFGSGCHDVVLCLNVLEHVLDYTSAVHELYRILRPGGRLYGRVPFLMHVHADPSDYWRYTKSSLEHVLREAGFEEIVVEADGGLFLVILNLLDPILRRSGPLKYIVSPALLALDGIFAKAIGASASRERYPLGYFFVAKTRANGSNTREHDQERDFGSAQAVSGPGNG